MYGRGGAVRRQKSQNFNFDFFKIIIIFFFVLFRIGIGRPVAGIVGTITTIYVQWRRRSFDSDVTLGPARRSRLEFERSTTAADGTVVSRAGTVYTTLPGGPRGEQTLANTETEIVLDNYFLFRMH